MQLLKILYYWLKAPNNWDFIDQGLGIEARALRCRASWQPHLLRSMLFQREVFVSLPSSGKIAVLGAGRLFDLDVEAIKAHRFQADLYDADPGCAAIWSKEAKHYGLVFGRNIVELTGVLDLWTRALIVMLKKNKDMNNFIDFLKNLDATPPLNIVSKLKGYDLILSLNLLGQIPLYWRDRVAKYLLKYWKVDSDQNGKYQEPLDSAIRHSMATLQLAHLALLDKSQAKRVALISDRHFLHYRNDLSLWQEDSALYENVEEKLTAGWGHLKPDNTESWFWHIAPQGLEQTDFGVIHDVIAVEFTSCPITNQ